ncbi:hypothetical protein GGP60_003084 [Salinibacter ruber]|nr:sulfotransferase family 2 domain-containing protein [Salinibacter ruber]MCS4119386.1 hypothetical protein [Salinibacter ruber]
MKYRYHLKKIKTLARKTYLTFRGRNLTSPVIFFHVQKCGGTSVRAAILDRLGIRDYLTGRYFTLDAYASREATEILGTEMRALRENVLAYEVKCSPKPVFVTGHFPYSRAIHSEFEEYTSTTVIREPVDRFISQFFYNKNKSTQFHFGINMNIDEYLDSERAKGAGRRMTSYFAGNEGLNEASTLNELVERAIQNIRHLDVVGVLRDLTSFEREFAQATGTNIRIPHHRKNPTDQSKRNEVLTEERLERIRVLCAPDIRLYEAVLSDLQGGE